MIKTVRNKKVVELTDKQSEAWELLESKATNVFLYGGARSGKTFVLLLWLIYQCLNNPGLWVLITRLKYTHIKSSIWQQSLLPLLEKLGVYYNPNKSDLTIEFANDSMIWLGGLDDEKRVEKVLGQEYGVIYLNEISQLSYELVTHARTRLAQKIKGFRNKMLYDCNPPSPKHWAHREFMELVDPVSGERIKAKGDYAKLLMNPEDNKENLPKSYFKVLDRLPDRLKRRFKYGEWVKQEGMIYYNFDENCIIDRLPDGYDRFIFAGVDFGLNMAMVFIAEVYGVYYVIGDYGAFGMTSSQFNREAKKVYNWRSAYCDPSGGERINEINYGEKAINDVEDGIDYILELINQDRFKVHVSATGVLSEIWDYRRDEKGRIIKENDHYMDAMRYGIYTYHKTIGEKKSLKDIVLGGKSGLEGIIM